MGLDGLPSTKVGIAAKADREGWPVRASTGIGGTRKEYVPPAALMSQIRQRAANQLASVVLVPVDPRSREGKRSDLIETDAQRLTADARKGILTTLDRLMLQCGMSRQSAMETLLDQAASGALDDHVVMMLRAARDSRGRKGNGLPSVRTLKRWLAQGKAGDLVPKFNEVDYDPPVWAKPFCEFYQLPQKPSVEMAYRNFAQAYHAGCDWELPTIHQVRRFLGKLGKVSREIGRMGPRELKNLRPFVRRTFADLLPNDVWSADGHTFDAEVQHPLHGRPFRPEITAIIDIATRMIVGFSIGLSESSLVVLEAISDAAVRHGLPSIFYVDNGSGYNNHLLKKEGTGLQGLLGFQVKHSLPYNSQAKGVIERSHRSIWVEAAKLLHSYVGSSVDREHRLAHFKITRAAVRKGGVMPLIGWDNFVLFCADQVDEYNKRPHRSLPKFTDPESGRRRHMSPADVLAGFRDKGWEPMQLGADEVNRVFRPRIERVVQRGEVVLFNNRYFSQALTEFNGDLVHVAYDVHDAHRVWIHHTDGRYICSADAGANEAPYFPMSVIEQAREKRRDARIKRLDQKREEVEAEYVGRRALTAESGDVLNIPGLGRISRGDLDAHIVDAEIVPIKPAVQVLVDSVPDETAQEQWNTPEQRYARWIDLRNQRRDGVVLTEEDARFYERYQQSKEFAVQKRHDDEAGEGQLASL